MPNNLTEQDKNALMLKMPRACLENEVAAMNSRWWEYRGMSPVDTTYLFAKEYKDATIAWNRMCKDDATAESRANYFVPEDIFKSRDLYAIWMARQHADLLCIPYGFLMHFAIRRQLNMTLRHMPRPNQLYSDEFHIDLTAAWSQRRLEFLQLPTSADFRERLNRQDCQSAWRGQFKSWLFEQVRQRPGPHERILGRLIHERLCSEAEVAGAWDQDVADRALRVANMLSAI